MAGLTESISTCCTPVAQATCCAPSQKSACCATGAAGGSCGCAAGAGADVREIVRERYAAAALATSAPPGSCGCGDALTVDAAGRQVFGSALYDDLDGADGAVRSSLGCGVPTQVADLRSGETVLDLGSGGGADVLISARRVGPGGTAIGLDMTDEMLALARTNAADAGLDNVEFLKGYLEEIPLPRRVGRRGHLELRDQPGRRQAQGSG